MITVTVTDAAGASASDTFTPTVNAVNDAPTAITLDNAVVQENQFGQTIGTLTVIDPDAGDTHIFTFSDDRFEVASGLVKLKDGQALDYESSANLSLRVVAADSGDPPQSVEATFVLTVINVNEPPTAVTLDTMSVLENLRLSPPGSSRRFPRR